jgi:hypothetical protein
MSSTTGNPSSRRRQHSADFKTKAVGGGCYGLLLVAAACLSSVGGQVDLPAGPAQDRWTPPNAALDFARRLNDATAKEAALAELERVSPRTRIEILRAGLRLADGPAAVACASRLGAEHLDAWESRRVIDLLLPVAFSSVTEADYNSSLRFILGCDDLPRLFESMPDGGPWDEEVRLGKIHVYVRAEHLPVIAPKLLSADPRVRSAAEEAVSSGLQYTDKHREAVAAVFWQLAGRKPDGSDADAPSDPEPALPGLSLWLRRMLQVAILEDHESIDTVGAAAWTLRWLATEIPGPLDVPLLLDIAGRLRLLKFSEGLCVALRALGRVSGDATPVEWDALASGEGEAASYAALGARARRGDRIALSELKDLAQKSGLALAFLFDAVPEQALGHISTLIKEGRLGGLHDSDRGEESEFVCMETLAGNYALDWDRFLLKSATNDLIAPQTPLRDLCFAFLRLPGFRTKIVAGEIMRRLEGHLNSGDFSAWLPELDHRICGSDRETLMSALEVTDGGRLRSLLRGWARADIAEARDLGCRYLLLLGDPLCWKPLMEWILDNDPRVETMKLLGRSSCPELVEYLKALPAPWELGQESGLSPELASAIETGACLAALACALGVAEDFELDETFDEGFPRGRTAWNRMRGGDVQGALDDMLAALQEAGSAETGRMSRGISNCDHPAARSYLEELRQRRELGRYWWATGQLAIMGDEEARAEIWDVVRTGRYGTCEEIGDVRALSLGRNVHALNYWVSELESNCCRVHTLAGSAFFEEISLSVTDGGLSTLSAGVARQYVPNVDELRRSRILGMFVVVPG